MRRKAVAVAAAALVTMTGCASIATSIAIGTAASASPALSRVVGTNPVNWTPHVRDNGNYPNAMALAYAQVGNTMYAGGSFRVVANAARTTTYTRYGLFRFNATTGAVSSWAPNQNGSIWAIEPSADGRSLFISGTFTSFAGVARSRLVKYDIVNNRVDTSFRAPGFNDRVTDLQLVGGRLFASGRFSNQGTNRVVALNPNTGANTGYLNNIGVTGSPDPSRYETDVYRFSVNPQGTKMVAIGSFTSVGGAARRQAAIINLGTNASMSAWYSPRWNETCATSLQWYTRDVDWDPTGSWFGIVATGAGFPGTVKLCDTTTRWSPVESSNAQPTWVNYTGGDTLHALAVTSNAVYVQGHQRWLDNPLGRDTCGAGCVSRPGIGAIDPTTGRALSWNPTKAREEGKGDLYITPAGLWTASDGGTLGGENHQGIGLLPL